MVVISSYLPEIMNLSDRILVCRQGRIVESSRRRRRRRRRSCTRLCIRSVLAGGRRSYTVAIRRRCPFVIHGRSGERSDAVADRGSMPGLRALLRCRFCPAALYG